MDTIKKELKVGDKIIIKNWANTSTYTIDKVGKKFATAPLNNGTNYKLRFYKDYSIGESGRVYIERSPRIDYDTNDYYVIPAEDTAK